MGKGRKSKQQGRYVATLKGRVLYADSGYTEAEWRQIGRMMAKCVDPRPPDGVARKKARGTWREWVPESKW